MIDGQPIKVSCGLGVNSVAMLVGLKSISVAPDAILFADTGSEHPETYDYIPILRFWLSKVGFPDLTIVKNPSPKAKDDSLFDECVRKSMMPSICYGFQGHSCAVKWKVTPQERWCRSWPLAQEAWAEGRRVWVAVGYDAGGGDCRRYAKQIAKEDSDDKQFLYWYPLQQWGWDRDICVRAIQAEGLPVPAKSSCMMCGAKTKPEILAFAREHPALMRKVIAMERQAIPKLRKLKGLGSKFSWADYLTQMGVNVDG